MADLFKFPKLSKKEQAVVEELRNNVLNCPVILDIIKNLKLTEEHIKTGFPLLVKYYLDYIDHQKLPEWKIIINSNDCLDMDITNTEMVKKEKILSNFWLTDITPLPIELHHYLTTPLIKKPRSILTNFSKAIKNFDIELNDYLSKVVKNKLELTDNLLIIDNSFLDARAIIKFLSTFFVMYLNKTVAVVDINALYQTLQKNSKNPEYNAHIFSLLSEVDYLFLERMAVGEKPEWFINELINVFNNRNVNRKPFYLSSPVDILSNDIKIIATSWSKSSNVGLEQVEQLFKSSIALYTRIFKRKV
ncbi:Uncharacterised protein [Metamycoplasma cloacale]|uniref:Uncharacterized protein n=1 Tax=Metamycoplasma cloacale TaxID=92401 RepID=A0A2Z4LL77_9BACT|nr:hypothetical protein [Metamycoplasma cloacale]AWX42479.1 hypothetical protein DK849_00040 [Metamycoplasma cloacale]VEU79175.1 Uncharacterised protein [Metamycoplasma cloacale]